MMADFWPIFGSKCKLYFFFSAKYGVKAGKIIVKMLKFFVSGYTEKDTVLKMFGIASNYFFVNEVTNNYWSLCLPKTVLKSGKTYIKFGDFEKRRPIFLFSCSRIIIT